MSENINLKTLIEKRLRHAETAVKYWEDEIEALKIQVSKLQAAETAKTRWTQEVERLEAELKKL